MSLRQPKCLRASHKFLVPVGPFMDDWGTTLGSSNELSLADKAEIICALYEGFTRQNLAFGYIRAFRGLIRALPNGLLDLESELAFDMLAELKKSKFYELAQINKETFEEDFKKKLETFKTPLVDYHF